MLGGLSWNRSTKCLTVKGTIFIDGSIYIEAGGTARYTGNATIAVGDVRDEERDDLRHPSRLHRRV